MDYLCRDLPTPFFLKKVWNENRPEGETDVTNREYLQGETKRNEQLFWNLPKMLD